jgi:hypothetical protein
VNDIARYRDIIKRVLNKGFDDEDLPEPDIFHINRMKFRKDLAAGKIQTIYKVGNGEVTFEAYGLDYRLSDGHVVKALSTTSNGPEASALIEPRYSHTPKEPIRSVIEQEISDLFRLFGYAVSLKWHNMYWWVSFRATISPETEVQWIERARAEQRGRWGNDITSYRDMIKKILSEGFDDDELPEPDVDAANRLRFKRDMDAGRIKTSYKTNDENSNIFNASGFQYRLHDGHTVIALHADIREAYASVNVQPVYDHSLREPDNISSQVTRLFELFGWDVQVDWFGSGPWQYFNAKISRDTMVAWQKLSYMRDYKDE